MENLDREKIITNIKNDEVVKFQDKRLVLASNSLSRAKIMERESLDFIAIPSFLDEEALKINFGKVDSIEKAKEYVLMLSREKARWVNKRVKNAVIIGSDTVAFYKDEILEKPKDETDARRIFSRLSDTVHYCITGVAIIDNEKDDNFYEISEVKMQEIPKEVQDELVKDELTYTYAGGYCVDGNLGDRIIVKKEDFYNVMGLPIEKIQKKLEEKGYNFKVK
jgi:septum formation protein